jgi:hypothetical protein
LKIRLKEVHIEYWVKAKEWGKVKLKRIVTHNLGDGVGAIMEGMKLLTRSCKAFFLQLQPNFVSHLKLVWHSMLIMALLVLSIRIF